MGYVDHEAAPQPDPLTRLRGAAAAVADLHRPADDRTQAEPDDRAGPDAPGLDMAAHADRFDELHDALVAVLADVDRG